MSAAVTGRRPLAASTLLGAAALLAATGILAKRPIEPLVSILEEAEDYKQRLAAVIGLGRIGDKRAVPALIDTVEDDEEHPTVRGTAASVLGQLGDRRPIRALAVVLKRAKDRFVRQQTQQALELLRQLPEPKPPASQPVVAGGATSTDTKAPRSNGPPQMTVKGTLGTLDRMEVQKVIQEQMGRARDCFARRFAGAPYLGGKLFYRARVATDGTVKWLRLARSNLGSLVAERCISGVLTAASFPKPRGGEAEFTVPLAFGGGDKIEVLAGKSPLATELAGRCQALLEGAGAAPAGLQVTAYIDHRGQVVEAGLAAPAEIPVAFADRFIANLKQQTLVRRQPASGYAKLVYRFTCAGRRAS